MTNHHDDSGWVSLSRGSDWVMCCICFEQVQQPFEGRLAPVEGEPGKYWDVCVGRCAADAGVTATDNEILDDGLVPIADEDWL